MNQKWHVIIFRHPNYFHSNGFGWSAAWKGLICALSFRLCCWLALIFSFFFSLCLPIADLLASRLRIWLSSKILNLTEHCSFRAEQEWEKERERESIFNIFFSYSCCSLWAHTIHEPSIYMHDWCMFWLHHWTRSTKHVLSETIKWSVSKLGTIAWSSSRHLQVYMTIQHVYIAQIWYKYHAFENHQDQNPF